MIKEESSSREPASTQAWLAKRQEMTQTEPPALQMLRSVPSANWSDCLKSQHWVKPSVPSVSALCSPPSSPGSNVPKSLLSKRHTGPSLPCFWTLLDAIFRLFLLLSALFLARGTCSLMFLTTHSFTPLFHRNYFLKGLCSFLRAESIGFFSVPIHIYFARHWTHTHFCILGNCSLLGFFLHL